MNKDIDNALKFFAEKIWTEGEKDNYSCCLIIDSSIINDEYYVFYSQVLYDNFNFTHYSRLWKKMGKIVLLKFGEAEYFGACIPKKNFMEFEVKI